MKKIKVLFIIYLLLITNGFVCAMEQPSAIEVGLAELRYRVCRAQALPEVVYITNEQQCKRLLDTAILASSRKKKYASNRAQQSAGWSTFYGFLSLMSCCFIATNGCHSSLDQKACVCTLCGIAIFTGYLTSIGICDFCKERAEAKRCEQELKQYQKVKQLEPLKVIVQRTEEHHD